MKNLYCLAPLVLWLTACGEPDVLDVGDEKGELGEALSDYAAVWDGYAQAYAFKGDGTDRVRITIDQNGEGTIRLGEEALIPPATDPDAFYPPNNNYGKHPMMQSGFEYPITGAKVENGRLQFEFVSGPLMDGWCQLQESSPLPGWSCGYAAWNGTALESGEFVCSYEDENGDILPLSCTRAELCGTCFCDDDGCRAMSFDGGSFDAVLSDGGQTLTGTLVISNDRTTVIMTQ